MADWFKSLDDIHISQTLEGLRDEGDLVYEYNPFKVLRQDDGKIIDLETPLLNFDINHPVDIDIQVSYDGSSNLIINDNKNPPRLINSRFIPTGLNTYKIADREGDQDSNIYNSNSFESDISLYKKVKSIVNIDFLGITQQGNLKVGNYVFYFKGCDDDGNESDFIGESGIVTCYKGNLNDPKTIDGGFRDEVSYKAASFYLSNIDTSYTYISVYYTRSTSDLDQSETTTAVKIDRKFPIYNGECKVYISGFDSEDQISLNDINASYTYINKCQCQAISQNRLFFGNFIQDIQNYKIFQDLALRMLPYAIYEKTELMTIHYNAINDNFMYYDPNNIYYRLGYWDEEIYRFGIVFIQNDYSLSPVFNIRGINKLPIFEQINDVYTSFNMYNENGELDYIQINKYTNKLSTTENSAGVCRFQYSGGEYGSLPIISLGIYIDQNVLTELRKISKGFFIVRQKRIPTILCQALITGYDEISHLPALKISTQYGSKYMIESFLSQNFDTKQQLVHDFNSRIYTFNRSINNIGKACTAICPEYELRQPYFNSLFTGGEFMLTQPSFKPYDNYLHHTTGSGEENHFYLKSYNSSYENNYYQYDNIQKQYKAYIIGVPDNTKYLSTVNTIYSARAGEAEEAWRVSEINYENSDVGSAALNLARGSFGSYLGIETLPGYTLEDCDILNIRIPGYDDSLLEEYFQLRYQDDSAYYAVTDRLSWDSDKLEKQDNSYKLENIYRGDCYICQYTHRMNRNFQDPDTPTNDDIVNKNTWKDNYQGLNPDYTNDDLDNSKINRGDVNAVKIGHWVTFTVRANINLSIRSTDSSNTQEVSLTGINRSFYPIRQMFANGNEKIPESQGYNKGISSTTSDKYNFVTPDVPAFKQNFQNRIIYSNITANDSFRNGFRLFLLDDKQDFPSTYGAIIKLIELYGSLLCVCEHGALLIPVNERSAAGSGIGGTVYINTDKVLPQNPKVLSDTYGSQWPESVIKTQTGSQSVIYGIDTVAKKIWKTDGNSFQVISDFMVQEFLNNNINLGEQDVEPTIGLRNVKSHYNAFKGDVMFTFYNSINAKQEVAWNICYNQILNRWTTFYSWIPSYSANIDNIFFSFDRNTSKIIASNYNNISIQLDELQNSLDNYVHKADTEIYIGKINVNCQCYSKQLSISDLYKSQFKIYSNDGEDYLIWAPTSQFKSEQEKVEFINSNPYIYVGIEAKLILDDKVTAKYINQILIIPNYTFTYEYPYVISETPVQVATSFWKHGQAGLMQTLGTVKPTNWYGKQHPFEFEFVVAVNPQLHKIFDNLQIISNNAEPESFHYEIIGDCYNFANDKKNMYIRQEATKELYNYNGSDITYDTNYLSQESEHRKISNTDKYDKSTILPLYYSRQDKANEIEDYYHLKDGAPTKDFSALSGSEIVYYNNLDEYRLWEHSKAVDISKYGRLRGNMQYKEDLWDIQINPINIVQCNEDDWVDSNNKSTSKVPVELRQSPIPSEVLVDSDGNPKQEILIPQSFNQNNPDNRGYTIWQPNKVQITEAKLKDKWIKIRIRYSGTQQVIITAIKTLYSISYS